MLKSTLVFILLATFCHHAIASEGAAAAATNVTRDGPDKLPVIDLSQQTDRQVVIAQGTEGIYQGHPTTLLMPDGRTMFCVWTLGHGGTCGPIKRSDDGGRTWSDLLTTPDSWRAVRNCPTIYRLTDPAKTSRLIVYAGQGPDGCIARSVSRDGGKSWSDMTSTGLKAVMPFCTIAPIDDGARLLGMTNIRRPGDPRDKYSNVVAQSVSEDGGLTWTPWRIVADTAGARLCEPLLVRSPDGAELACIMRENTHKASSLVMFSRDEGKTWSRPIDTPWGLTGDRHMGVATGDGRLVIAFRDQAIGSSTRGHFVAWIGTYRELHTGGPGQCRIKLLHSYAGGDCGYPGLQRLPDGTIVAATYIKYRPGAAKHSVVSTRFTINQVDRKLKAASITP